MINPYRGGKIPGRGKVPIGGMPGREKAKLWIFAGLFVLVLAIFIGAQIAGNVADQAPVEDDGDLMDAVPIVDEHGRTIFKYHVPSPEQDRDEVSDDLNKQLVKFWADDKLVDGRDEDNSEVLTHLVNESIWNFKVTKVSPYLYDLLNEEKVLEDPGPWRGVFASAWGKVEEIYPPRLFEEKVEQVDNLYSLAFRTAAGQLYHVTSTVAIDRQVGDWIQVYGIFYRLRPVTIGEGSQETAICLMLVKEQEVMKAYPPAEIREIDPAWAKEIREKSFEEAANTEERPFWLIMNYARTLGVEGYEALKDSPEFVIEDFGSLAKGMLQDRENRRFSFVAANGSIIAEFVDILKADNPGKIDRIDSAFLLQPREYLVRLVSPRPWSEYDVVLGEDFVRVEGIFYKRYTFVPAKGPPAREIPLMIVTNVYPIETETSPLVVILQWFVAALAVVIVVFFLFVAFRDRKQVAEFRARYRDRQAARGSGSDEAG